MPRRDEGRGDDRAGSERARIDRIRVPAVRIRDERASLSAARCCPLEQGSCAGGGLGPAVRDRQMSQRRPPSRLGLEIPFLLRIMKEGRIRAESCRIKLRAGTTRRSALMMVMVRACERPCALKTTHPCAI